MEQIKKKKRIKWQLAQFLEIRWWQWYLRKKRPDAYLTAKSAYWQRVLDHLGLVVPAGARVLDAGCGPAGIFMVLPQAQVLALDPLLAAYAEKLPHFAPENYPWVQFITTSLEDFSVREPFDLVFCLNAINHVDDLAKGISILAQATASGHSLIISIDAHRWSALKWLFRLLPGDALHPHQHSLSDYLVMLQDAGFSPTRKIRLKPGVIFDYWILQMKKTSAA